MNINPLINENMISINETVLDYKKLRDFEFQNGTSFYILNVEKLRENYKKIYNAFNRRYENFIIGYSYKTNYVPYLCKELHALGAYAEVVSRLEYDLAIKLGVEPKKIIFNGPNKSKEDIFFALKNDSKINIDSLYELDFIQEYSMIYPEKTIKVGLRVNFDISVNDINPIADGFAVSRFGICLENGNLEFAINKLKSNKNVKIAGLHGHFSTSTRSTEVYKKITEGLCNVAKEYNLNELEYIDVGGGISGEVPFSLRKNAPTFDEYAESICTIMNHHFGTLANKPALILEPGISIAANVFLFITKVIEVKKVRNSQFIFVDGCVQNIKPTINKKNLPMKIIRRNNNFCTEICEFDVVGFTCMEKDYLAHKIVSVPPQKGDYFVFENVGAYTIVFTPPFIKERPAIVAIDDGETIIIRKKETFKQFFNEELYLFN